MVRILFDPIVRLFMDREWLRSIDRMADSRQRDGQLVRQRQSRFGSWILVLVRFGWKHRWSLFVRCSIAVWLRGNYVCFSH